MAAMTFLQICSRLRQDCIGVSGTGPTTVLAQTGDMKRIVDWTAAAYEDIQNLFHDWDFLRDTFTFQTVAAQQTYTPTQAGAVDAIPAADLAEWVTDDMRCYLTSAGVNGEVELDYLPWDAFRRTYLLGSIRATTGQPYVVTVKPDKSLMLWPTPDAAYTVSGEYFRSNSVMAVDADVPIFPARFHLIIVHRALVAYAAHSASPETYTTAQLEYTRMLHMLKRDQHWKVRC